MLQRILVVGVCLAVLAATGCGTGDRVTSGGRGGCHDQPGLVDITFADTVSVAQALAFLDGLGRPYSSDDLYERYLIGMRVLGGDTLSIRKVDARRQELLARWRNDSVLIWHDSQGIVLVGFFLTANPDSVTEIAGAVPDLVTAFVRRGVKTTELRVPEGAEVAWVERIGRHALVTRVAQSQWCPI